MNWLAVLTCALLSATWPCAASAQTWAPWSLPESPSLVGAQFAHDDGGALIIYCNKRSHLISYMLREPHAKWQGGTTVDVTTRIDDGTETGPSHGHVLKADTVMVQDESTFDIYAMGASTVSFSIGAGGYARTFPMENFKAVLEPVLRACGDHW